MTPRLAAHVEVSALIRRAEAAGGNGTVVARGDRQAGSILVQLAERGECKGLLERRPALDGSLSWTLTETMVSKSFQEVDEYLRRRRRTDPDLWIVELDIVGSERFAAEMVATG